MASRRVPMNGVLPRLPEAYNIGDYCVICYKTSRKTQYRDLPCGHNICHGCAADSFRFAVSNKPFNKPRCFLCPGTWDEQKRFPDQWAKELLRPREWTAYRDLLDEDVEKGSQTAIYCHGLECGSYLPARRRQKSRGVAFCGCGRQTCMGCHEEAHQGETCETALERWKAEGSIEEKREAKSLGTIARMGCKHCPQCKTVIEKSYGCDAMWCPTCKQGFNWSIAREFDTAEKLEEKAT